MLIKLIDKHALRSNVDWPDYVGEAVLEGASRRLDHAQ